MRNTIEERLAGLDATLAAARKAVSTCEDSVGFAHDKIIAGLRAAALGERAYSEKQHELDDVACQAAERSLARARATLEVLAEQDAPIRRAVAWACIEGLQEQADGLGDAMTQKALRVEALVAEIEGISAEVGALYRTWELLDDEALRLLPSVLGPSRTGYGHSPALPRRFSRDFCGLLACLGHTQLGQQTLFPEWPRESVLTSTEEAKKLADEQIAGRRERALGLAEPAEAHEVAKETAGFAFAGR